MIVPRPRGSMTLATSRPIRKPPKQAISQTFWYTRAVVSVMPKRTLAPMLNTATSIGAISRSMRLDQRDHLVFLARIAAEAVGLAAFGRICATSGASLSALRRVTQAM